MNTLLAITLLLAGASESLRSSSEISLDTRAGQIVSGPLFGHYEINWSDDGVTRFRWAANQYFIRVSSHSYGLTWHYTTDWRYRRGG